MFILKGQGILPDSPVIDFTGAGKMKEKTLIIHGWSDTSSSFTHIKDFLAENDISPVEKIYFGDYKSQEDSLTFYDVADGLNSRMIEKGFIDPDGSKNVDLNVIVHSTGGPVIRHWIWRYYLQNQNRMDKCPVNRLVMLAPANFGSPLAHLGKSFPGSLRSLVKSLGDGKWNPDDFLEVGKKILTGLELASPYQWKLAHWDLIEPSAPYRFDQIQTTVLVGNKKYSSISRKVINKPGTDGTVVIAGTSLDSLKLTMDAHKPKYKKGPREPIEWKTDSTNVDIAFGFLRGYNHSSIKSEIGNGGTLDDLILDALRSESESDFREHKNRCDEVTEKTFKKTDTDRFQQFFLHTIDDQDQPVDAFTVEFSVVPVSKIDDQIAVGENKTKKEAEMSAEIHDMMTENFHTHAKDPSYRSFLINLDKVKEKISEFKKEMNEDIALDMCVHVPEVDEGIKYETDSIQNVIIHRTDGKRGDQPAFLFPNTTTLVELFANRTQDKEMVRIENLPK